MVADGASSEPLSGLAASANEEDQQGHDSRDGRAGQVFLANALGPANQTFLVEPVGDEEEVGREEHGPDQTCNYQLPYTESTHVQLALAPHRPQPSAGTSGVETEDASEGIGLGTGVDGGGRMTASAGVADPAHGWSRPRVSATAAMAAMVPMTRDRLGQRRPGVGGGMRGVS